MKLIICALLVGMVAGVGLAFEQTPSVLPLPLPLPPPLPLPQPAQPIYCTGEENPCDPNRPWMRGTVEKSCAPSHVVEKYRKDHPGKIVEACACRHKCDPNYKYAKQTDNRRWDATCSARCSPKGCYCMHPCDT